MISFTSSDKWQQLRQEMKDIQERSIPADGPFVDIELTNPRAWKEQSEHFRAVAEVVMTSKLHFLTRSHDVSLPQEEREAARNNPLGRGATEYLLLGLGIELLLKAIWFAQRPGSLTIAPKAWKRRGHDLPFLSETVGLDLSPNERRELEDLSEYVLRLARYPSGFARKGPDKMFWSVNWKSCVAMYDRALKIYCAVWERFAEARKLGSATNTHSK